MNPIIELIRHEENYEHGTFGIIKINKEVFCCTLEPRDEENATNISSIPAQQYMCRRIDSPKYGDTFIVSDVPGRSHVLFHSGNIDDHTKGCILLGQYWGKLGANRAIMNSGNTFKAFMNVMAGYDQFHLTISSRY